jgi:hypothetical protein
MNFTQHALDKLELYGLDPGDIADAARKPIHDLFDRKENSKIRIIRVKGILLSLVIASGTENLITVYRTDERTIDNRKEAGRWI